MVALGNVLTHYRYRLAEITANERDGQLAIRVRTAAREADLHLVADLTSTPAPLPPSSPFVDIDEARRYAGPLPYTFDYERSSDSIVAVKASRRHWNPEPIDVDVQEASFLESPEFFGERPVLANAFYVNDVDYRWERGELLTRTEP
jgi:hypothetical protein